MYMLRKNKGYKFIFLISIIYALTFFMIFSKTTNYYLNYLKILPICFTLGITFILLIKNILKNLVYIIILIFFLIRMLIYPLLCIKLGMDFETFNNNIDNNILMAVFIQCYEFFMIIFFMFIYNNKKIEENEFKIQDDFKINRNNLKILTIFILISLLIIMIYPQILWKFRPIIILNKSTEIMWTINSNMVKTTMPKLIYNISLWILLLVRILVVYLIIIKLKSRNMKFSVSISIFLIASLIIITPEDRASSFFAAISLLGVLYKIYPEKRKKIIRVSTISIFIIAILVLFIVPIISNNNNNYNGVIFYQLRDRINAYFGGIENITAVFDMKRENLFNYFISDILRSIPLVMSFFSHRITTNILFNISLGKDLIYNSQILPNIGQGYFYFGIIFAPIFSIILLVFALKCYDNLKKCNDSMGYFINLYSTILFSFGIFLYNFTLTLSLFMQYIAPIYIIYKILRKNNKKLLK